MYKRCLTQFSACLTNEINFLNFNNSCLRSYFHYQQNHLQSHFHKRYYLRRLFKFHFEHVKQLSLFTSCNLSFDNVTEKSDMLIIFRKQKTDYHSQKDVLLAGKLRCGSQCFGKKSNSFNLSLSEHIQIIHQIPCMGFHIKL